MIFACTCELIVDVVVVVVVIIRHNNNRDVDKKRRPKIVNIYMHQSWLQYTQCRVRMDKQKRLNVISKAHSNLLSAAVDAATATAAAVAAMAVREVLQVE